MRFGSDNWAGAAPEVMAALQRANEGLAPSYGADALSAEVEQRFGEIFGRETAVFLVATGGAANGIALASLSPPWGMIFCHEESHVQMDECAGPEFFTGGAKLVPLPGDGGKIAPATLRAALAGYPDRPPHGAPPSVLSLTQASECGTVYRPDEIAALCAVARGAGMKVHMDGARFANAVARLGCAPADITWKAGVDVLCFGGTKNGAIAAEAVVFFDPALAADVAFRRKRAGHLWSKQRFIAAQFDALLADGLWLRLAAHANTMADRLAAGLQGLDGVNVWRTVEANEVFVSFPEGAAARLRDKGAVFFPWVTPGDPAGGTMNRFICSYATREAEVDSFLALARETLAGMSA